MKSIINILAVVLCCWLFTGCKNSENKKETPADLITLKTLGLAYLEEFKLEEAEAQFLQFIDIAPKEKLGYANLGLVYLRMAKYPEAEKQLLKAITIDPKDPDIRHILAIVYKMKDDYAKAISELQEALKIAPDHVKVLYDLTEIYATLSDIESEKLHEKYLTELTEKAPGNIVPKLNLTEIYIRNGNTDASIEQLEIMKKQFPDFPKEANQYYDETLKFLRKGDQDNAIIQFTIFHNYLKVSSPYQAGIMELKGPGGSLIGFPLITFDQQLEQNTMATGSAYENMKYVNVTATAGLDIIKPGAGSTSNDITFVKASDFDSDGDIDLYVGSYDEASSSYRNYLMNNDMGRFTDITKEAGINHTGTGFAATFADFDNDGFLDLYVAREGGDKLYRNAGKATFEDVTAKTKINNKTGANKVLFFDPDHDGDLDLLELKSSTNLLFRNNADGTFVEQAAKMGITGSNLISNDAAFGDFDEDGDIDIIVINENGSNVLYDNQRQGFFRDMTEASGLKSTDGSGALAVGDYDNDGFLDVFITSVNGTGHTLFRNLQNGTFERDIQQSEAFLPFKDVKVFDTEFLDFDNDGFLDIIIAGEPASAESRGLLLFHNNGKKGFSLANQILPEEPKSARQIAMFDYNDDGDLDLALAGLNGGVYLLRNDGGNSNHFIKMKLVGLKAGSAKNNHFGIGAKIEVRSGDLYQTMVVTDPNVHFGLGNRKQADVVRITWTNGVPQNIFMPNSDQALIESQTLKGSCPFLYTWNGEKYVFAKDILWRSALGMPLGIMGGTTAYGFANASDDYIKIPGELLKPKDGKYSIQITSELWETIYFDKLELIAVDHPDSIDVFVPEQFTPPPFPGRKVYQVSHMKLPVSAMDSKGNDVLPSIIKKDDVYFSGFTPEKYQGIIEMEELILDPGKEINIKDFYLFLNGWIFPTDASINVALSQNKSIKVVPPVIQIVDKSGNWVTVTENPGFPMGKDKTVIVDLSGKFLSEDHRIRIFTNMEIYWDYVFFADNLLKNRLIFTEARQVFADLHYRGFSESYRKGGRYGPHWFDYSKVSEESKWRDLQGNYTRFGNVLHLLAESDNQYIISNAGDEVTVEFDANSIPKLPDGWKRDFLIRSVGWVKDGDLNTAYGHSVLPLPFHGMKSYTPDKVDAYPKDPKLIRYNKEYNTRVITSDAYLNAIK